MTGSDGRVRLIRFDSGEIDLTRRQAGDAAKNPLGRSRPQLAFIQVEPERQDGGGAG